MTDSNIVKPREDVDVVIKELGDIIIAIVVNIICVIFAGRQVCASFCDFVNLDDSWLWVALFVNNTQKFKST